MRIRQLHRWHVDCREAIAIQERLRDRVVMRGTPRRVRLVAGADVSYDRNDDHFHGAVVVLRYPELDVVEEAHASGISRFPYVPRLLTFREGPILLQAFRRLTRKPDLVLFDGQGVAHPRGIGLAAHMGVILDVPSIGCAKTRLCGKHDEVAAAVGSTANLVHQGTVVGLVLRTRENVKPVFVSVGHRMSLKTCADWVLRTCRGYRLPEPTRQAHLLVNRLRVKSRKGRKT